MVLVVRVTIQYMPSHAGTGPALATAMGAPWSWAITLAVFNEAPEARCTD